MKLLLNHEVDYIADKAKVKRVYGYKVARHCIVAPLRKRVGTTFVVDYDVATNSPGKDSLRWHY